MYEKETVGDTVRESEIPRVCNQIQRGLDELEKEIACFEERLTGVLNGGGLSEPNKQAKTQGYSSPFSQQLNGFQNQINMATIHLNQLRNRIEL